MGNKDVENNCQSDVVNNDKNSTNLPEKSDPDEQSPAEINTQQAVNLAGFGKFNYKIIIISGLSSMNTAFGITTLGFVLPSAACDFQMSTVDKGRLNTGFIFGMLCGAYIWGCLADTMGRRYTLLRCLFLQASFECLASLIPNYWGVFVSKTIIGFALGGEMATLYTYVGEFQPAIYRKKVLSTMEIPTISGIFVTSIFAWLIIPLNISADFGGFFFHSWNLFNLICAIPSLITAIWLLFLPETPKYLSEFGNDEELFFVLSRMYRENTGKSSEEYLTELNGYGISSISQLINPKTEEQQNESKISQIRKMLFQQTGDLLRPPFLGRTLLVCTIMFCIFSSMFTLMMWFPELFDRFAAFESMYPNEHASVCRVSETTFKNTTLNDSAEMPDCPTEINTQVYVHSLTLGAASIPVAVLFPIFVNRIGFKISLIVGMSICAGSTIGLFFVRSSTENLILSSIFQALISICSTVICCVVVEIFPTKLRATAAALGSLCARSGALIGNTTFSYLIDNYCMILITFLTCQLIVGGVLALFLPNQKPETSNKKVCAVDPQT
ncbi:synaptic vesicle glycoprotein 2B [Microplitis demolitor]|uniref:synaptic vesicle glycoprotein 2B n=1 Tax=Microplitis demolitor TaxID=69319 RepID=UPI0004CCD633|nr:synaptic vesicle glycoprotein 2B [Microplitis demolitor]